MTKKEENANKSLIFYFTSRVLFMIIAIILISSWCCMFVHADSGSTLMAIYNIDSSKLNPNFTPYANSDNRAYFNSDDYLWAVQNIQDLSIAIGSNDPTTFHPSYAWDAARSPLDFNGVDVDNNFIICCSNYFSGIGVMNGYILIPKDLFIEGKVCFFRGGFIYATESFDYTISSTWQATTTRTFTADGSAHIIDLQQALSTSHCYFCSCPYWDGEGFVGNSIDCCSEILDQNNDPFYYDTSMKFFNSNYFMYNDISNLMDSFSGDHESAKNHLFLKDFQIGLTGSDSGIDIVQSNLVCGVTCGDNYQVNNINDFNLRVTVSLGCSTSSVNVPDFVGSEQYEFPLATFTSKTFDYSMYDIFRDIDSTGVGNFLNYYNTYLKPSSSTVAIRNVPYENYTGLFPTIANQVYKYLIGSYKYERVQTSDAPQIDELTMSVTLNVVDNKGNLSGSGTKVFNFLNGTNSVTVADILRNNDPWEGESEYPDIDPNAPSGSGVANSSGGATAIAYGGNTTINVNNSNGLQNNIVNGTDPEETQNIIDRYTDVMGQFHQDISSLSSIGTNENNGFLSLLIDTYSFIPGLSYIALSCGVIFGLCVILFIIKVLLF